MGHGAVSPARTECGIEALRRCLEKLAAHETTRRFRVAVVTKHFLVGRVNQLSANYERFCDVLGVFQHELRCHARAVFNQPATGIAAKQTAASNAYRVIATLLYTIPTEGASRYVQSR